MLMLLLTCGHHTMPLRDHFVSPVVVMWCDQVSWRQPTWTSIGSIKKFVTAAGPYQLVSQDSLKFFVCLKRQKEVTIENKHSVSSLLNESQKIRTVIHFLYKCKVFYFHSFVSRHRKNNKVSDWHVSKKKIILSHEYIVESTPYLLYRHAVGWCYVAYYTKIYVRTQVACI